MDMHETHAADVPVAASAAAVAMGTGTGMIPWLALGRVALPDGRAGAHVVARSASAVVTHAQWIQSVRAWCSALLQVPGPEVALYCEDVLTFSAALWGAWHAGKTPVLASDAQAQTLAHLLPQVAACIGQLPQSLAADLAGAGHVALQPLDMEQARVVLFTSGSTGVPQRIDKRLSQLDAEVQALQAAFGPQVPGGNEVQVQSTVAHHHIYGLLFRILWPLAAGRAMGTGMARYPEELLQQLQQAPRSLLVSSPAMLERLPSHLDWPQVAGRLNAVFSSGGPLSAEASQRSAQLLGPSPAEVFGSSETGGIAWRRRAEHGECWQALPGVELRLSERGCLCVRSRHLADAVAWYETADQVLPAADGAGFVLQGRADRIVKIAEKRVSLAAMERALQAHPWVRQARAVVLDQPQQQGGTQQRVGMVVELTEPGWQALQQQGRRATGQALRALLASCVERVALPRSWRYVARMPMNSQGKTTQHSLQTLFHPVMPVPDWLQRNAFQATARLLVQPHLRVLEGHFPGATLVPGVAQLDWVVRLGTQAFGLEQDFCDIQVLKFQQPILPGDWVTAQLEWRAQDGSLRFELSSARGVHASGRLLQKGH